MTYLIGIDVGSSDCKVVIIDTDGHVMASARQSYPTHHPQLGWVEQHPHDWYDAACHAVRTCLASSNIATSAIAGISVDGPAHHVALLDKQGAVIRPTIHWSDLRSTSQSQRLQESHGDWIFDTTFTQVNPSWTLSQLLWLRDYEPDTWAQLRIILATKDYVTYRLTGNTQTDVYDAIGIQCYDIHLNQWSQAICDVIDFDARYLPPVQPATHICGHLLPQVADDMGLRAGIPVAVGSGDSVVEAAGIGAAQPGDCIIKLGTAANVNLVTEHAYPSRQSITYRHVVEPHWFTITATNSGASTMRWFRDTFARLESERASASGGNVYELIDQLAENAPPGSDGLLFHPYLNGERTPYWDPDLRGDFVGIHVQHTTAHFARAVLEGVAFSIRDCLRVVQTLGQPINRYFLLGGGAKSHLWRQVLCDVLGVPVHKPAVEDAAFGAALLAGIAVGIFPDWETAIRTCTRTETVIEPTSGMRDLYDTLYQLYRDITRDLTTHNHRLAELVRRNQTNGVIHENRVT